MLYAKSGMALHLAGLARKGGRCLMPVRGKVRKEGIPSKGETHRGLFKQHSNGDGKPHASLQAAALKIGSQQHNVGGTKTLRR